MSGTVSSPDAAPAFTVADAQSSSSVLHRSTLTPPGSLFKRIHAYSSLQRISQYDVLIS
ncbi:hypothetical protein AF91_01185 [Lacticaseibacillus paracasei N1115]|uniref:Uncharacterized protein n=1 Tax=Lacticaseibacillus paracasei N1115 TaxID=1446494 RepID=A0A806LDB8_LACPA|nr:hypothetical protein AF91_01185 [Lacticaseibacillus paracasei N1115]